MGGFITEKFFEWLAAMGMSLSEAYTELLALTVRLLLETGVISVDQMQGSNFEVLLGGTLGFASYVMVTIAVAVALAIVLSPLKNHGTKISHLGSSMVIILLFAPLFYPLYSVANSFARGFGEGLLNLAMSNEPTDSVINRLVDVALPLNDIGIVILAFVGMIISGLVVGELYMFNVWLVFLLIFYPLVVAARPISKTANKIFHACNSGIVVILFVPTIMTFGLIFPIMAIRYLPGGNAAVAGFIFTVLGGVFALAAPLYLLIVGYRASSEVFGSIDSSVTGAVDINKMPPVTVKEMDQSVDDSHGSALKPFAAGVGTVLVASALSNNNTMDEIKSQAGTMANLASTALASSGHPVAALGAKAIQMTADRAAENQKDSEGSQS